MAGSCTTPSGRRREQRAAARFTLILRAGKLACEAGQFLCVLRDASASGVKARLFHPLPECPDYELELASGERYRLERVWQRGVDAGFRFAEGPIDIHALLSETGSFPKRTIRLQMALPVQLESDAVTYPALLCDLSQHGALVELDAQIPLGQPVRLECAGLPVLHGRVRWRRESAHGLVFQESFRFDDLARRVAALQLGEADQPPSADARNSHAVNQ
ncbi:MAG: PilZ domain-containing protein [Novosphingobium sp.]|uniref:PilZ domain-containing protein n=1 Tax=Novosphingobium sp. TaxID=1874826 RepID=UPI0018326FB1|nr:PilZ domain-containing protein [Novosphingobium sp.]